MKLRRPASGAVALVLAIGIAGCGKTADKERFPGYSQVGKEGEASQYFFASEQIAKVSGGWSIPVVKVIPDGYYMYTLNTDCVSRVVRDSGTQFGADGSPLKPFPGTGSATTLDALAEVRPVVAAACAETKKNRVLTGEYSDALAMELLFGDYSKEHNASLWAAISIPKSLQDNASEFKDKPGLVRVVSSTDFSVGGKKKRALVTKTTPSGVEYNCHACAPLVGLYIFSKDNDKWRIELENPYLFFRGTYGDAPSTKWVQVGDNDYGLLIEQGDMHGGVTEAYTSLYLVQAGQAKTVFENSAQQAELVTELLKGKNAAKYDIRVIEKNESTSKERYFEFAGDKYVEARPPAGNVVPAASVEKNVVPDAKGSQATTEAKGEEPIVKTPAPIPVAVPVQKAEPIAPKPAPSKAPQPTRVAPPPPAAAAASNPLAETIKQMLDDGNVCMSQKNFSCAITNATHILRLAPGDARGTDLKARAQKAQQNALDNIKLE